MRPVVVDMCWHCAGTGQLLASVSPFRFQICPICYGQRGRTVARYQLANPTLPGTAKRTYSDDH
jgi:hypothetical protein